MARQKRGDGGRGSEDRRPQPRRGNEPVEVRREVVRGSGKKTARLDLESKRPLDSPSSYQDGLVAAHGEASSNELERAAADRGQLKEDLADVDRQIDWRLAGAENAIAEIDEVSKKRDSISESARAIGEMALTAYVMLMVLFASAEYPLLKLSFTRLPVDDRTIRLISILVGLMFVAGVHVLGRVASRVVCVEGERSEGRRDWGLHLAILVAGGLVVVSAVIALAVIRGSEIGAVSREFSGQGVSHPAWLGVALGLLHALVLLSAFYLAYQRARGAGLRAIEDEIAELEGKLASEERELETLERRRDRLLVRLATLEEVTQLRLEQILRLHKYEESGYLAILRRELADPPAAIEDWLAGGGVGRRRRSSSGEIASGNGRERRNGSSFTGKARPTAARRVKPALRNANRKEERS
jgi:hypothetical protein